MMEGLSHIEKCLHRDPKKKKGLFGLCAAIKATSTAGECTPAQTLRAAPIKSKCKLLRVSHLIPGRTAFLKGASWDKH